MAGRNAGSSAAWGANLGRGRGRRLAAGALGLPRQVRRQAAGVGEEEEEEPLGADMERAELSPTQPWERPASQRSGAGSGEGAAASDTGGGATVAAAAALDPASLLDPVEGMGAGAVFVGPVAGGPSLRESAERASQERFKRPSTVASRRTSRRGPAASVISLDLPPARAKTARGRPTGRPKGLAKSQKQRKLEQRAAAAAASAGSSLSIIGLPRGRRARGGGGFPSGGTANLLRFPSQASGVWPARRQAPPRGPPGWRGGILGYPIWSPVLNVTLKLRREVCLGRRSMSLLEGFGFFGSGLSLLGRDCGDCVLGDTMLAALGFL